MNLLLEQIYIWLRGFDFKLVTLEQQGFGGWHVLFQGLNPHYSWLAFSFPPCIFGSMIRLRDGQKHIEGGVKRPSFIPACVYLLNGRSTREATFQISIFIPKCVLCTVFKSSFVINSQHTQDNKAVGSPHFQL